MGSICLGSLLHLVVTAGLILLDNAVAVVGIFLLLVDLGFIHTWRLTDHELVQRLSHQVLQLLQCRLPHQQVSQLLQHQLPHHQSFFKGRWYCYPILK
jgi:hypothetical protein